MAIIPSGDLLRAARAMVGWSQTELAKAAGLSRATVHRLENRDKSDEADNVTLESLDMILKAYFRKGVEFTDRTSEYGEGVRWMKSTAGGGRARVKNAGNKA